MEADFWLQRWREGQTRFHQERVTPLLQKYWPSLLLPSDSRVLVPLCGKSLDLIWLSQLGHRVLGVELSPLAVDQFFSEHHLRPKVRNTALGSHYTAGNIEIICGDVFALDRETLGGCTAVYDRAALIALPVGMRERYTRHVYAQLSDQYRGLLLTLDYNQDEMGGPPFSVSDDEVQALFDGHSQAKIVDRRDILAKEPKFAERGLSRLDTVVYQLSRKTMALAS